MTSIARCTAATSPALATAAVSIATDSLGDADATVFACITAVSTSASRPFKLLIAVSTMIGSLPSRVSNAVAGATRSAAGISPIDAATCRRTFQFLSSFSLTTAALSAASSPSHCSDRRTPAARTSALGSTSAF